MPSTPDEPRGQFLTRLAFAVLLMLLVARSLMLETIRDAGPTLPNAPAGPGATTSLVLDWLSLLPVLLILARRLFDRTFTLRAASTHVWLFALAIWAMLSTVWADDRFLSFVSSTRLLAAGAMFWSATQLVRRWSHVRLIAGLFVGLLLANVTQGLITKYVDQPEFQTFWQQNKAAIFAERNWSADSYEGQRFEQKVLAGELFGFNASPNVLASLVVMFSLVAIAAAIQRLRNREPIGWPLALILLAGSGGFILLHTGSKAAFAALFVGAALFGFWAISRRLLARQRPIAFACAIVIVGLGAVGVVGYGLTTGGLPSASINFRWRYWVGAWRVIVEHASVGVGWSNFAEHYLPVRLPQAAEEIQDPHNFVVRVAAELGVVGLILLLGWLLSYAWRATRPIEWIEPPITRASTAVLAGLGTTFVAIWAFSLFVANDWSSILAPTPLAGSADSSFLLLDAFRRLLLVATVAAGVALVLLRRRDEADDTPIALDAEDEPKPATFLIDERPAPWLVVGLVVALGVMLLQSAIDVTLFQIAPLLLFATAAGATLGIGWRDAPPRRESLPLIGISVAGMTALALLVAGVIPIGLAESKAAAGRSALMRQTPDVAARHFASAYESTFPLNNVDYAANAAQAYVQSGPSYLAEARRWLDVATQADPAGAQPWLTKARIHAYWMGANVGQTTPDEVLADFARGLARNPSDAALQLEYADLLERFGRRIEAAAAIAEALRIDDELDATEPERLDLRKPGERDRLAERMQQLQSMP